MSHTVITMGDRGRLVIPAKVRQRLGLATGDQLVLDEHDGELRLAPLAARARALRGAWAQIGPPGSLADELIADRRREAAAE